MSDIVNYFKPVIIGECISELPKSKLPASAVVENGKYPFICSSSELKYTDSYLQDKSAVVMGTGGMASVHLGKDAFAYSTDTWAFRSNSSDVDTEFLFRKIQQLLPEIDYAAFEGSGLKHLRKDYVKKLEIAVPHTAEISNKILSILAVTDQTIEKTEALIEKYQQIKAGLMHDLFTRGIGADSKLRPPRAQAPDLYQETPIGWIPKEWHYDLLENLLAPVANNLRSGPFGSALLKSELAEDGIPFLGIDNIHIERFDESFRRFVSERKYRELIKYAVRPRDVVITIMGTVGRAAVIPPHIDTALSSKHLWTMTLNQDVVIPELVCWQLNYAPWVKAWFRRETQGGIMDAIQSKTLRTLVLPLPSLGEQQLIFERYKAITSKIEAEKCALGKQLKQKTGLMHDLLTGKVTVKIESDKPNDNKDQEFIKKLNQISEAAQDSDCNQVQEYV
ncbi:MAG: restriction endonuclease subunit S [Methylobacter sp.]|uniref:restriction endonuclease subunit S n=1 Tax=Methylobacter sp. TaxID=2051955 RepID=UPI00258702A8|nr:restriction endonuclease subunit S [Methylobacter sp.]MCL7419944.1 restriction endonuclease subunit S [Methylobacter sp.]